MRMDLYYIEHWSLPWTWSSSPRRQRLSWPDGEPTIVLEARATPGSAGTRGSERVRKAMGAGALLGPVTVDHLNGQLGNRSQA